MDFSLPKSNRIRQFLFAFYRRKLVACVQKGIYAMSIRIFDEKAKIINYLNSEYLDDFSERNAFRKRKIIREAVDEIFLIHWDHRYPESRRFHRAAVHKILEKMKARLHDVKHPTTASTAA